jgi:hypothetical protein
LKTNVSESIKYILELLTWAIVMYSLNLKKRNFGEALTQTHRVQYTEIDESSKVKKR